MGILAAMRSLENPTERVNTLLKSMVNLTSIFSSYGLSYPIAGFSKLSDSMSEAFGTSRLGYRDLGKLQEGLSGLLNAYKELTSPQSDFLDKQMEEGKGAGEALKNYELLKKRMSWSIKSRTIETQRVTKLNEETKRYQKQGLILLGTMFGLQSVSKLYNDVLGQLFTSNTDVAYAQMDLNYAFEDMGFLLEAGGASILDFEARIVESFSGIIEGIDKIVPGFAYLTGGLLVVGQQALSATSTIANMVVAFWGLKAGFSWLREHSDLFDKIATGAGNLFKKITDAIPSLSEIKTAFSSLGTKISDFASSAGVFLKGAFDGIKTGVKTMASAVSSAFSTMTSSAKGLALGIGAVALGFTAGLLLGQKLKSMFGPIGAAAMVLAGTLIALAGAWAAMHTASAGPLAPIVGPIIVGGIAMAMGGVLALSGLLDDVVPKMALGGKIETAGIAMLHPGELVVPKNIVPSMTIPIQTEQRMELTSPTTSLIQPVTREEVPTYTVNVNVNGLTVDEALPKIVDAVSKGIESRLKRSR